MTALPEFIRLGAEPPPSWLDSEGTEAAAELEPKPFADVEFARRVDRVRSSLSERDFDAILVFRPSSVDYLCGHHTVETAPQPLLVTADVTRIYVPDPEVGRALASGVTSEVAHYSASEDALALAIADVAVRCPRGRIAIEDRDPTVPPRTVQLLSEANMTVEAGDYLVEKLRLVLSSAEVECMDRAAESTARGADAAREVYGQRGLTDSGLAAAIGEALRGNADSSAAMDVIIATGKRGGVPHSTFRNIPLSDETTFVEFAGTHQRYHAPLMLTLAREVSATARRLERLSQTMLETVLTEVRPGRRAAEVAETVAEQIELEQRDIFHFNFGYAIGLAHPPGWLDGAPFSLVADNESTLKEGMAFHIPASLRSFGDCGVGLSHAIVLDADGPRVLTGGSQPSIHMVKLG